MRRKCVGYPRQPRIKGIGSLLVHLRFWMSEPEGRRPLAICQVIFFNFKQKPCLKKNQLQRFRSCFHPVVDGARGEGARHLQTPGDVIPNCGKLPRERSSERLPVASLPSPECSSERDGRKIITEGRGNRDRRLRADGEQTRELLLEWEGAKPAIKLNAWLGPLPMENRVPSRIYGLMS